MDFKKYQEGIDMEKFPVIKEISAYNYNYHVGFDGGLLLGKSDDDNTTEWWLIEGTNFYYLGESYATGGEKLHRFEKQQT